MQRNGRTTQTGGGGTGAPRASRNAAAGEDGRFRAIADRIPQIVWTATADGIVDYASKAFYDFAGTTPEALSPAEWASLAHPDDLPHVIAAWETSIAESRPHVAEFRLRRADGAWRWHFVTANPVLDEHGRATRWYGAATDVHDRREAQETLERTRRLLEIAERVGRFGGWSVDLDSRRVEWSEEVRRLHELPPGSTVTLDEAIGFYPPEYRGRIRAVFEACARDGTPYDEEMKIVTAKGRRRWIRTIGEPVRDGRRIVAVQGAFQDITMLKESEAWNERYFRARMDAIPLGVWTALPDGTLDYASKALYDFIGSTPDLLPPHRWPDVVHPDDRDRAVAEEDTAYAAGVPFSVELRLRRADGVWRWFLDTGSPIRDETGRIVKWYGTTVDIHDRKLAEEALRDSEQRLRAIVENEPEGVKVVAPDGTLLEINPAGLRMIGAGDRADAIGRTFDRLVHPDDRDAFRALHRAAFADAGDALLLRLVGLDGDERWTETRATPLREADGTVGTVLYVTRDLTERRLAEMALAERVKELRCLYRALDLTRDEGRTVPWICDAMVAILPEGFVHDRIAVARIVLDDAEYRSANWRSPVASLRAPIPGGGQPHGFVEVGYPEATPEALPGSGVFLDEEQALVEGVAIHIGRMLDSRRMREQVAQSERLRAVGELTGGVAHDFNNLLTVILGATEQLRDALSDDADLGPIVDLAGRAATRGAELTDRLLAFGRRQALDPQAVRIEELLAGMGALLRRTLGDHIEIAIRGAAGGWRAEIDPSQFENAMLNLCINARDAMPEGGRLTIEVAGVRIDGGTQDKADGPGPGDYVMVAVSDTGTGMPPNVLDRAFEPFFTTKPPGAGNGLGLSMVFGFMKQSNGHVRVVSAPDEGTSVRLYLPRAAGEGAGNDADRDIGEGSGDAAPAAPREQPSGGSETILLVEDDDLVRHHVAAMLEGLGYAVIGARNGPEALDVLRSGRELHLMFTDVVMPGGMTGRQLATEATAMRPGLPVVLTSGYTEDAILRHGRLDEGIRFLAKPYRRHELAARIREALDEAERRR